MDSAQRERIETALREMTEAENELGRVLRELRGGPRAEKTAVSAVVEAALAKLKVARATVADLQKLLDAQ
jgi:phage-related tail protein